MNKQTTDTKIIATVLFITPFLSLQFVIYTILQASSTEIFPYLSFDHAVGHDEWFIRNGDADLSA